jgi:ubiquitin-conjugating enzyme E2 M
LTKIFHPNIDLSGNVCLNLLKVDIAEGGWSAAKSLIDIITGIFFLFQKPNSEDPLNKEAADLLH